MGWDCRGCYRWQKGLIADTALAVVIGVDRQREMAL
jgi:hypothetical protein